MKLLPFHAGFEPFEFKRHGESARRVVQMRHTGILTNIVIPKAIGHLFTVDSFQVGNYEQLMGSVPASMFGEDAALLRAWSFTARFIPSVEVAIEITFHGHSPATFMGGIYGQRVQ